MFVLCDWQKVSEALVCCRATVSLVLYYSRRNWTQHWRSWTNLHESSETSSAGASGRIWEGSTASTKSILSTINWKNTGHWILRCLLFSTLSSYGLQLSLNQSRKNSCTMKQQKSTQVNGECNVVLVNRASGSQTLKEENQIHNFEDPIQHLMQVHLTTKNCVLPCRYFVAPDHIFGVPHMMQLPSNDWNQEYVPMKGCIRLDKNTSLLQHCVHMLLQFVYDM